MIETLTPVQVGSGTELHKNLDYTMRDRQPFVVDKNACFDDLAAQGRMIDVSSLQQGVTELLKQSLKKHGYSLASLHGGQCNPRHIREHLKDAQSRPYLAGSSLKGAIRTALLAEYIRKNGVEADCIPANGRNKPLAKQASQKLSHAFFGKEPKSDWMRAWKVGDSTFTQEDLRIADVRFLNLGLEGTQSVLKWKDMKGRNSTSDWKNANGVYAEVLAQGSVANVQIHVDDFLFKNDQAKQTLHWFKAPKSLHDLREEVNAHAFSHLQREIEFYEKYKCHAALASCQRLMKTMETEGQAMYLQVGWGSGWRGMTGDWQHDAGIEDDMRSLFGLGKKGADEFPKTRRLAVYDSEPSLPFGWLRLWPEEACSALVQQAETQKKQQDEQLQQRNKAIQSLHQLQQEKIAVAEQKRLQDEEERLKQQAKADEKERLAAMSPFEQELENILAYPDNAVGGLMEGLQSKKWQGTDVGIAAQHLKALLQKNGTWRDHFSGKNKQKKKQYEKTLIVMAFLP